jgi:hypothetical protein
MLNVSDIQLHEGIMSGLVGRLQPIKSIIALSLPCSRTFHSHVTLTAYALKLQTCVFQLPSHAI